jgi:hypothetical protein
MTWPPGRRSRKPGSGGRVAAAPYCTYRYDKRLTAKQSVECHVTVYLLEVEQELEDWPEKDQRERRWLTPSQAALDISESGLIAPLLRLGLPREQ